MIHKSTVPRILIPHTVNEALSMRAAEPMAEFWAGGTTFSDRNSHKPMMDLPPVVIVLSRIEELTRAFRTEQSLEIGAMTTLEKLVGIGRGRPSPGAAGGDYRHRSAACPLSGNHWRSFGIQGAHRRPVPPASDSGYEGGGEVSAGTPGTCHTRPGKPENSSGCFP